MVAKQRPILGKESYQPPRLRVLGTLAELTRGAGGPSADGLAGATLNTSMGNEYHSGL